ncbi:MAG TPA: class I SAM-dependent methyltransferase [Candidatus Methylomirabilis sp.]|nr:class I SAM-dependent methyltransferase [Candidatus Methylomirabilis sp.]
MKYRLLELPRVSDTDLNYGMRRARWLRHPVYACLGLRPALAQHTAAEHALLKGWAAGRKSLVEIGVAEGVSALALRESMAEGATLYLIDPFHLSRVPALNFMRRTAHKAAGDCRRGKVIWLQKFSHEAVHDWNAPIDFILIDGDHSENAVARDWEDWSKFVEREGIAVFHDARLFDGGWTKEDYGPVKLVNRLFRQRAAQEWTIVEEVDSTVVVQRS